jgi:four helix bundle protein
MTEEANKKPYDLEERTALFAENIIRFCKIMPSNPVTTPIVSQLIRSATSIGANYAEANNASSKKDFRNKIYITKKECQETKYWLRMIAMAQPERTQESKKLWKEVQELTLIFQKISNTLDKRFTSKIEN